MPSFSFSGQKQQKDAVNGSGSTFEHSVQFLFIISITFDQFSFRGDIEYLYLNN